MAFQGGLGGVAGLQGRNFFGGLVLAGLRQAGGTGKFTQIIFPVGVLGQLTVIDLFGHGFAPVFGHGFRPGLFAAGFLQKRVFHQLLLDRFQKFQTRELQQFDGLLQLRGHHQLLCQL